MENHKRRIETFSENDIISNLPEHLIDSIFERLPLQDVVKTSILSTKWRYKWTRMKALVADKPFSTKFVKNGAFALHGFIRIINRVLLLHEGLISKFHLYVPNIILDSFQEVDQWILLLSRKGVRDLAVFNSNKRYQLPSYVFSCQELRKLTLVNCLYMPPPSKPREFPYLENLFLTNIDFGSVSDINLPQLIALTLDTCTKVYNFNIKATKLQKLIVQRCPDAMLSRLLHSKYLCGVVIYKCKPVQNLVQAERMSLTWMLNNMPMIKVLIIDGHLLKSFIAEKIPKWLSFQVYYLVRLELRNIELSDLNQLECVLCLLRNSPNLSTLTVRNVQKDKEPQDINYDVELASNNLEAPDCLDQTLNKLQTVTIMYVLGLKPELLFIKLLLAHSPCLEKMRIEPSQSCDAKKRLNIATDVMRFSRASTKAEVILVNSNP